MKQVLILFCLFFTVRSFSKNESVIHTTVENAVNLNLYLPGLQFRFQDGMDQSRSIKTGYSLNMSVDFYQLYMLGIEYNIQSEKSGNSSLSLSRDMSEINLAAGYRFLQISIADRRQFNLLAVGYLGQNQNKIKTELLGNSVTDQSEAEITYGLGLVAQAQLNYLLLELDTRMMSSKSYEPQTISVTDLRIGFQIPLK